MLDGDSAAASSASVYLSVGGTAASSARENRVGWVREESKLSARLSACIAVRPGKVALVHTPTAAEAEAPVCAAINPLLSDLKSSF